MFSKQVLVYTLGNQGAERVSNLSEFTQLVVKQKESGEGFLSPCLRQYATAPPESVPDSEKVKPKRSVLTW